ncbi:MAG: hypothetical protein RIQ79_2405 [Verrucomicrobiota bacterium]
MATIGNTLPTLFDIINRQDPMGGIAKVVEALQKRNPILQDMPVYEGNLPTGHKFNARTALPSPTYRKFNQGVAATKSVTEQVTEACAMLESYSKVDCGLADLNSNAAAFRASEDNGFLQGFNIEVAQGLFYNSTAVSPEKFHGLSPRLSTTTNNVASGQIIKADATASGADQTSVWLVGWGEDTVCGIYPKGHKQAGFMQEDLGKQLTKDANNNDFTAWVTHYIWKLGLAVKDYRYVVRVCNVDTSAWKADLSTGADLVSSMIDAAQTLFDTAGIMPRFYMNRATAAMLNKQLARRGGNNMLQWMDAKDLGMSGAGGYGTVKIPVFLGIPIRVIDALTITESVIT